MKSVLISIQPKWCELITSGKKTLEVRKTRPKLETPFKCYIYCTSGTGKNTFNVPVSHEQLLRHYAETGSMECLNCPIGNGKVIGEFICDSIHTISAKYQNIEKASYRMSFPDTCLSDGNIIGYLGNGIVGYAWHISDLKIYDKPKELSEFIGIKTMRNGFEVRLLERPPQSWCYVEEGGA